MIKDIVYHGGRYINGGLWLVFMLATAAVSPLYAGVEKIKTRWLTAR